MRTLMFFSVAASALYFGCTGPKAMQQTDECKVPDWYMNVPEDPNYFYSPQTATSQDMQMATDKCKLSGRTDIQSQVEVKLTGLGKRFQEEIGSTSDATLTDFYSNAMKQVLSGVLNGSRPRYQIPCRDGNMWRSYVLMEYAVGAANAALVGQLKRNQDLYDRYKASKGFQEMEEEAKKFEDSKQ